MEIIKAIPENRNRLKAALFDFDGTISTLRCGWESVMKQFMLDMIEQYDHSCDNSQKTVEEYIEMSAGIQTIYQMQWLADMTGNGVNAQAADIWSLKDEYNRRLMLEVDKRKDEIKRGSKSPDDYMIIGSREFLEELRNKGLEIYVASGTDHPDVMEEVGLLKLHSYFTEIKGAPIRKIGCSKEEVMAELINCKNLREHELAVIGDGKVEISLAIKNQAIALGVASSEVSGKGISIKKKKKLVAAGAHAIVVDFSDKDEILSWLMPI